MYGACPEFVMVHEDTSILKTILVPQEILRWVSDVTSLVPTLAAHPSWDPSTVRK